MLTLLALIAVMALGACAPTQPRATLEPTLDVSKATATAGPSAPETTLYPVEAPVAGQVGTSLWTVYPPMPQDESIERGEFFVQEVTLTSSESEAGSFELALEGSLPTPCHAPRVVVSAPDAQNVIQVETYSVFSPDLVCVQVIQPFSGKIAVITGIPAGTYTVMVNETLNAGQVTVP